MSGPEKQKWPPPLRDEGIVEFAADDGWVSPSFKYKDYRSLLQLIHLLQRRMKEQEAAKILFRIAEHGGRTYPWKPLSFLFETLEGRGVTEYLLHRCFTTYLQPIVQPNRQIIGYECLLRPLPEQPPFRPAELFEKARKIGVHSFLDREARHAAIRICSCHLPKGVKRFINFLPSSLHNIDTCLQSTFDLIRETGTDPEDIVFEVVETEPLDDPNMESVIKKYREWGIRIAMDDAGSGYSTDDIMDRLRPDYVKVDRKWISHCESDPAKQQYLDRLLERVSRFHGVVLAEGVEREEEFQYLRKIGVPLFQGYLFGRPLPVPVQSPPALTGI
jgi:EAL domain-containing protein (putative c-di-GMP-specific phosphodiesterase class I)